MKNTIKEQHPSQLLERHAGSTTFFQIVEVDCIFERLSSSTYKVLLATFLFMAKYTGQ